MDRRFQLRLEQLLADCNVPDNAFENLSQRLKEFAQPFLESLPSSESRDHGHTYISGLLSDVARKNTESIAYRHDKDRQVLQRFIGYTTWDHKPLLDELTRQVAAEIGEVDAVIVFDPSAFAKHGTESVGVQRQWCGRLGKTENCQVGVYMGYVTQAEQVLVDERLYVPKEWTRTRLKKCGAPKEVKHQTRHELAIEMLNDRGSKLPHGWIAGDDEMGRPAWFREKLSEIGECYLLAVPSNTTVRDLEVVVPPQTRTGPGRGEQCGPRKASFVPMASWCESQPASAWTRIEVRAADKGPIVVEAVKCRVETKSEGRVMDREELLFVTRQALADGGWKYDYHLSNAAAEISLQELARVANAEHRIEQCLQRGKSEAGLADYQTRSWWGWHHHQTLSLLAVWFLVLETRRGKKGDASVDVATGAGSIVNDPAPRVRLRPTGADRGGTEAAIEAERAGAVLSLQEA
jgi:SRSO17 transposase